VRVAWEIKLGDTLFDQLMARKTRNQGFARSTSN
jgi:hypothetical protein